MKKLIAAAALTSIGLLGAQGALSSVRVPETRIASPARTVSDLVERTEDLPGVGKVVGGLVRPT